MEIMENYNLTYSYLLKFIPYICIKFETMRKIIDFTFGLFIVIFYYIAYVLDNLFCIFGIGTKLPFKDFVKNFYTRKLAYVRIAVAVFIYFLWKLIF